MASFEPVVLVFGCSTSIAAASLRLPVSCLFAFDVASLEQIINTNPQLSDSCLHRYFVILLDPVDKNLLTSLEGNHRVIGVYKRDMRCDTNQNQQNRQVTLDLTNDIVRFLTMEGMKELKLERISLVKIYYQQARTLKEWAMSLFKAEPCHILLISLNSSQENLDGAQQRLQKICEKIGYTSVVIRQLNDYIPSSNRHSSLLPYAQLLFNNEDPHYICRLLKQLSSIRLYLYGNQLCSLSEWSSLMISSEKEIMNDEDNWCAFIENEYVDNDVKWNFAFMYGRQWKVSRVAPLSFSQLDENPRFQSALRRSHMTFAHRQIEVTAEIFDWYRDCIERQHLREEPNLTSEQKRINKTYRSISAAVLQNECTFRQLSSFNYRLLDSSKIRSLSFIWLDEILRDANDQLDRIVQPFQWQFFDKISSCLSFIETQLREHRYIFLVVSGSLGNQLFLTNISLMKQIFAIYIYCAHLGPNMEWTRDHSEIKDVFNDSEILANQIKQDILCLGEQTTAWYTESNITDQNQTSLKTEDSKSPLPLPVLTYNQEQAHSFMAHQRTIDGLLCTPQTLESRAEMIAEFRHIYNDNQTVLADIDTFENTYHSHAAVQWYTRDSFVWRTINQALRTSNVDAMYKLRYILTDIYAHLNESYNPRFFWSRSYQEETFYRGQLISSEELDSFKDRRGRIISINTFLSTTTSMQIALMYASKFHDNADLVSVVFNIESNRAMKTRPYANISEFSMFPDEDEVLFAMGSVFQVGTIRQLPDADNVWLVHLKMIDFRDDRFNQISSIASA